MTHASSLIVIAPGRYGDLVSILPCVQHLAQQNGGTCDVMVSADFASVLEGVSYAKPVVVNTHFTDMDSAIDMAFAMRYSEILVARVCERGVGVTSKCSSFTEEQWSRLGCLDLYETLPLIFDKRNDMRERELVDKYHPITRIDRLGLYNFGGKSSPFPQGIEWLRRNDAMIQRSSPVRIHWVDLSKIVCHRIYDLLGLMDAAAILLTCDTATMHLAAASKVPTINFVTAFSTPWHGSKPRNNNILSMRYNALVDLQEPIRL